VCGDPVINGNRESFAADDASSPSLDGNATAGVVSDCISSPAVVGFNETSERVIHFSRLRIP
jgi:hypothetical protein